MNTVVLIGRLVRDEKQKDTDERNGRSRERVAKSEVAV